MSQIANALWQLFYILFMFGLVVLLSILVTRIWVKRGAGMPAGMGRRLRLLEFMPLGNNKGLYLVKVPDAVWLLAVTDQGVTILREFEVTPEWEEAALVQPTMQLPAWAERLLPKGWKKAAPPAPQVEDLGDSAFAEELMARLKQLKEPRE